MEKLIRDGKVAVLYSPGYGAGWYTWNDDYPDCIFNPRIVEAVEKGDRDLAASIAEDIYPGFYTSGAHDLKIAWLPVGTRFHIDEYDGAESIKLISDLSMEA